MKKKCIFLSAIFFLCLAGMQAQKQEPVKPGTWHGNIWLNDSTALPLFFNLSYESGAIKLEIENGTERIKVDEITAGMDSLVFRMPLFDSEFRCRNKFSALEGVWINHSRKTHNIFSFKARQEQKPACAMQSRNEMDGKWEVTFSPGSKDSTKAIGLFKQQQGCISGTFLTESGDYRFLSGIANSTMLQLSCFDGAHAYLFKAKLKEGNLEGEFYSGSGFERWTGRRNDQFELRNPDSLTYLRKGFDRVNFKFKNTEGKDVSLTDPKFNGKVVIIQIMGSWCPNCMDETRYLAEEYRKRKDAGLLIEALAFERATEPEKVRENLQRLKKRFDVQYEILMTGMTGNEQASRALPMLNAVMAFPTTIYLDRKGRVRKIYTGFYGPGTGVYYERFKEENELFLNKLLSE